MKALKEIAKQLKRIGDSLMMIEVTLLRINGLKYTDIEVYAKNYNESSREIAKNMEGEE